MSPSALRLPPSTRLYGYGSASRARPRRKRVFQGAPVEQIGQLVGDGLARHRLDPLDVLNRARGLFRQWIEVVSIALDLLRQLVALRLASRDPSGDGNAKPTGGCHEPAIWCRSLVDARPARATAARRRTARDNGEHSRGAGIGTSRVFPNPSRPTDRAEAQASHVECQALVPRGQRAESPCPGERPLFGPVEADDR